MQCDVRHHSFDNDDYRQFYMGLEELVQIEVAINAQGKTVRPITSLVSRLVRASQPKKDAAQ